jgi:hypothetical protein
MSHNFDNIYAPEFPIFHQVDSPLVAQQVQKFQQYENALLDAGVAALYNSSLFHIKKYLEGGNSKMKMLELQIQRNLKTVDGLLKNYQLATNRFINAFNEYIQSNFGDRDIVYQKRRALEEENNILKLELAKEEQVLARLKNTCIALAEKKRYYPLPRMQQLLDDIDKSRRPAKLVDYRNYNRWMYLEFRFMLNDQSKELKFLYSNVANRDSLYKDNQILINFAKDLSKNRPVDYDALVQEFLKSIRNNGNLYAQNEILRLVRGDESFWKTMQNHYTDVRRATRLDHYDRTFSFSPMHLGFDQLKSFVDLEAYKNLMLEMK